MACTRFLIFLVLLLLLNLDCETATHGEFHTRRARYIIYVRLFGPV